MPPAVYEKQKPDAAVRVSFPADQVDQAPLLSSEIHSFVNVSLNFVSDTNIPQVKLTSAADFNQVESDSDDCVSDSDIDVDSEELIISKPIMTRSGRQVKAGVGTV